MSLRGYKKKTKPALWTLTMPKEKKPRDNYPSEARAYIEFWTEKSMTCLVVARIHSLRTGTLYGHAISARLKAVHHIFGRKGVLKMWKPGWLPTSTQGHRWIHANVQAARSWGWYAPKGFWDNPKRVMEVFGDCTTWLQVVNRCKLISR